MTTQTAVPTQPPFPGGNYPISSYQEEDKNYGIPFSFGGVVTYTPLYGFGFSIPTGATINSITISVSGRLGSAQGGEFYVAPTKNGATPAGTEIEDHSDWFSGNATNVYGPSLFGTTWTAEEINASTFGCTLRPYVDNEEFSASYEINLVQITIDYTEAAQPASGPCKVFNAEASRNIEIQTHKTFSIFRAKKRHE